MSVLTGALSDRRPPTADGVAPIRPPAGRRDRRMLRLVASVAVVGGSIAAFSALYSSADHKVPAMVVVQPVPQGHAITSADLGVAQVAVSADVAYLPLDQAGAVSGRRAAVSLAAGTLLTAADLSAAPAVAAADAVVGVALKDGSYPSSGLVPGDRVLVVQTAAPGTSLAPPGAAAAVAQVPVATGAIATAAPRGVPVHVGGIRPGRPRPAGDGVRRDRAHCLVVGWDRAPRVVGRAGVRGRPDRHRRRCRTGRTGPAAAPGRCRTAGDGGGAMTLIALCSLKGAPGVTTLACLLGAAWPGPGPIALVEADPSGGDCAARFGLSARVGWTSLSASARRSDEPATPGPHLQELPGGLPVLVAARGDERGPATGVAGRLLCTGPPEDGPDEGLTIVDLGRLCPDDAVSDSWTAAADAVLLVVRGDAATAVRVRDRLPGISASAEGGLGLVVVGGAYSGHEVAEFTGVRVVGNVPFDPVAAEVATGSGGSVRRLERSPLWDAVGRLAGTLAAELRPVGSDSVTGGATTVPSPRWREPIHSVLERMGGSARRTADQLRVGA